MEPGPSPTLPLLGSIVLGDYQRPDASLRQEVAAVRALLLYADAVDLTSLVLAGLEGKASDIDERRALIAAAEVGEGAQGGLPVGFLQEHPGNEREVIREWKARYEAGDFDGAVRRSELLRAIDAQVLNLGSDWRHGCPWAPLAELAIMASGAEAAFNSSAIPLLDYPTWLFLWLSRQGRAKRLGLPEQRQSPREANAANEAALARFLVGRIEAFPTASIDVILDVRRRLGPALVRFRSAVLAASCELPPIDNAGPDERELAAVYRRLIAPELQRLDEELDDLGARAALRRGVGSMVATFGVLAGAAATVRELSAAAAIPVTQGIRDEIVTRRQLQRRRRDSPFFFSSRNQLHAGIPSGSGNQNLDLAAAPSSVSLKSTVSPGNDRPAWLGETKCRSSMDAPAHRSR